jgi:hypothetical protein
MVRRVWKYLHLGWGVVTEAHTISWLVERLGGLLLPAGIITAFLRFYGEHSIAVLSMVFAFLLFLSFLALLMWLGYKREVNGPHSSLDNLPSSITPIPGEIEARTKRRYLTAADAIRYIADESGWGASLRAAPPNQAGMRQNPRFAAADELVRGARDGELDIFGRLNRTGEHLLISQQYWLYATIELGSVIGATQPAVTIPISSHLGQRKLFTPYDGLCVERSDLIRVWPERHS